MRTARSSASWSLSGRTLATLAPRARESALDADKMFPSKTPVDVTCGSALAIYDETMRSLTLRCLSPR